VTWLALFMLQLVGAAARGDVTIAAVGHIVIGTEDPTRPDFLPPGDGLQLVEPVAPLLADADLTLGNLAAPLSTRGKVKRGVDGVRRFAFRTPPRYAPVLAALGLDVVLAANNHVLDYGPDAYDDTLAALDRLRIAHVGRVGEVHSVKVRGTRVAVIGFTQPYRADFQSHHDLAAAAEVVRAAAAGHQIVVALVHGGGEGPAARHVRRGKEWVGGEYRGQMVPLAHALVDAGADLVIGFGAHHPRAMETYRGRLIAYALGNFLVHGPFDLKGLNVLSMILRVTLDRRGALREASVVPLRLSWPGIPGFDPEGRALRLLGRLSRADFGDAAPSLAPDGTLTLAPEATDAGRARGPRRL